MSFDYYVAFPASRWPTSRQVQDALNSFGHPVMLVTSDDAPLECSPEGLSVRFEGRPVLLDASKECLNPSEDSDLTYIAEQAGEEYPLQVGDPFLIFTFRSDPDESRAGLYLAAALVKGCGGYGFENQYEQHGRSEFADQMVSEASNADLWKN